MQFSDISSRAAEYLYPSVFVGSAAGLGVELCTGSFNGKTSHRVILTSIIAAVAVQILAIHVGNCAAIGACFVVSCGVVMLKDVIKDDRQSDNQPKVYAYLAGIFLLAASVGYGIDLSIR